MTLCIVPPKTLGPRLEGGEAPARPPPFGSLHPAAAEDNVYSGQDPASISHRELQFSEFIKSTRVGAQRRICARRHPGEVGLLGPARLPHPILPTGLD